MGDLGSIEDFKKGNTSAFELLLLKYKDRIYTVGTFWKPPRTSPPPPGTHL